MKIVRLEIEGFRNFQGRFVLDLRAPAGKPLDYLVLSGTNGCGKTSILDAILFCLGREDMIAHPHLGSNTRLILVLEEEGVLHQIERTKSAFYPHRETPIAVEYFSAHRQSVLGSFLDQVRIDKLNAYWRDFRDDDTTFAMYEGKGLFLYKGQERLCPIDEMSSGEQGVVSIAMQLLRNPFEGLILIDEPEQHLHPRWQGRVVRAIRKLAPTSQVIVATHADDPWEDAMSWERRLLPDPRRKNI